MKGATFVKGDLRLGIGAIPNRKQIGMYVLNGTELIVLAWFTSEKSATTALDSLVELIQPKVEQ